MTAVLTSIVGYYTGVLTRRNQSLSRMVGQMVVTDETVCKRSRALSTSRTTRLCVVDPGLYHDLFNKLLVYINCALKSNI